MREWSCQWRGVHITVQKWTRGFRTGERLLVDGIGIDSDESWIWSRAYAYLAGPVSLLGSRHVIEAIIGQGKGWYRTVCPIIVDGCTVGGDRGMPLDVGDLHKCAREWAQTRERGILPFLMTGLWRDAIPLGVAGALAAALVQDSQRLTIGVLGSATGVLCALVMRSLRWRSSEIFFRLRELKHDRRPTVVG